MTNSIWLHIGLIGQLQAAPKLDEVYLFSDRAELKLREEASCSQGSAELQFSDIGSLAQEETFRAELLQGKEISSLVIRKEELLQTQAFQELEAELTKTKEALELVDAELLMLKDQHTQIGAYEDYFQLYLREDMRSAKPNRSKWKSALDTIVKERKATEKERMELDIKQRQLLRQQRQLLQQRAHLPGATETWTVTMMIDCGSASRAEANLYALFPQAQWRPSYELSLSSTDTGPVKGELQLSALLRQSTGVHWEETSVVLSTSAPHRGDQAPYPAPIYVDGFPSAQERVLVEGAEDRTSLAESNSSQQRGAFSSEGGAFQLELPYRLTLLSNGQEHWVPVEQLPVEGEIRVVAIPRYDPQAHRQLRLNNPAAYPLMAGGVQLMGGHEFLGKAALEMIAPGEELKLSVGVVPELELSREEVITERKRREAGRHIVFQRAYKITVINRSSARQDLTVIEPVPVSKDERIEIELLREKSTEELIFDEHRGVVSWELELEPHEERELQLLYVVKLPAAWQP